MQLTNIIEPFFQPIISPDGCYAYEALFRYKGKNELRPNQFQRWEKSGFVTQIDRAMTRKVLEVVKNLKSPPRIALNVSAHTLEVMPHEYLAEIIPLSRACPRLIIEITETHPVKDETALALFVERCKTHRIHVALDDCKLNHVFFDTAFIQKIRPRFLKLDGELLDRCYMAGKKEPIKDFIKFAESIDAIVIAECVDGPGKQAFARLAGAKLMQGNWIAKPAAKIRRPRAM